MALLTHSHRRFLRSATRPSTDGLRRWGPRRPRGLCGRRCCLGYCDSAGPLPRGWDCPVVATRRVRTLAAGWVAVQRAHNVGLDPLLIARKRHEVLAGATPAEEQQAERQRRGLALPLMVDPQD